MTFQIPEIKQQIQTYLGQRNIEFEQYNFDSGYCMIDIKIDGVLNVIQIEDDSIGLSVIKEEFELSTIPDERYYDLAEFMKKLISILPSPKDGISLNSSSPPAFPPKL